MDSEYRISSNQIVDHIEEIHMESLLYVVNNMIDYVVDHQNRGDFL